MLNTLYSYRGKVLFNRGNNGNSPPSAMSLAIVWIKRFWFQMTTILLIIGLIIFALLTTKSMKRMTSRMESHQRKSNSQILKLQKQLDSLQKSISDNEPLIFSAHGKTNKTLEIKTGETITYTDFLANVGWGSRNCFNLSTGEFNVPKNAVYEFTFYGFAIGRIHLPLNKTLTEP